MMESPSETPPPIPTSADTLTAQELQAAYLAQYDLGPGYPQMEVPEYIRRLYLDDSIEDLSLRFAPFWTPDKQMQVDSDLDRAVRSFLRIPAGSATAVRTTFSGSIALDRAIAAVLRSARARGAKSVAVVTTSPCIDIMRLFLQERQDVSPVFVHSKRDNDLGAFDLPALLEGIERASNDDPNVAVAVLLSSPENPTGEMWSASQLSSIASACAARDGVLIVDHCFAVAGVHDANYLARVWDLPDLTCDWIAIWDTGKTFGLNEDKLGFIIPGTERMRIAVDASLAVTQFGVARRQRMFFAELLRSSFYYGHVRELQTLCMTNLEAATAICGDGLPVRVPSGGSLLLVDISQTTMDDEQARQHLLRQGIGVVAGSVFFHTAWQPRHLLRIALARRPDYFAAGMERLVRALQ